MTAKQQRRLASWRALGAALVLLAGALVAPAALAVRSPGDVCAMACCVEDGHCCCKPRRASVAGQSTNGKPQLASAEVVAPCPEGCLAPSSASPLFKRQALRPADHRVDVVGVILPHLLLSDDQRLAAVCDATTPRAPPACFVLLAI